VGGGNAKFGQAHVRAGTNVGSLDVERNRIFARIAILKRLDRRWHWRCKHLAEILQAPID
jgi:hypothetical protein